MDFPALSSMKYLLTKYKKSLIEDPALVSTTEAGYEITRARYTRTRYEWTVTVVLDNTDKGTLESFINETRGSSEKFNWTDPADGQTYEVRFHQADRIIWQAITPTLWTVTFTVREV